MGSSGSCREQDEDESIGRLVQQWEEDIERLLAELDSVLPANRPGAASEEGTPAPTAPQLGARAKR